ncbi:hypothetical protein L6452_01899 [Arctium lappa]|uniref:Uncharacterized protein n=1 Tax=Arctium lappa TaxID=4217 RepID=A0ACB9FJ77_ARCLA|nr:hypothetical protein L6452_01899 [Arctium lappa]
MILSSTVLLPLVIVIPMLTAEFVKINPIGFVPALMDGDMVLADSFAIILYFEEKLAEGYQQVPAIQDAMPEKQPHFPIN